MNKFDKFITKFTIYAIPFVIIILVWVALVNPEEIMHKQNFQGTFWDILGTIFILATLSSFYIITKMVFKKEFRNLILGKIAGIKERDEREAIISGEAAKFSFLSTMAILIFLLFVSIFTVSISKYPEEAKVEGKNGVISLTMGFSPTSENAIKKTELDGNRKEIVSYKSFPLSSSMTIILILLWQLGSYKFISRRLYKELED